MKTFQNREEAIEAIKDLRNRDAGYNAASEFVKIMNYFDYYEWATESIWFVDDEWMSNDIRYHADELWYVKHLIEDIDVDDDWWIIDNNGWWRNIDFGDVDQLKDYIIDDIMNEWDITEEDIENSVDYYWDQHNYIHLKFGHMWKMYNFTDDFIKEYPDFFHNYCMYFNWEKGGRWSEWDEVKICEYIRDNNIPVHLYYNFEDVPYTIEQAIEYFNWYGKED